MPLDFPASPTNGQAYESYVYDSSTTAWRSKGGAVAATYVSDTAPSGAVKGDMWYRTSDGTTYVYVVDADTSQWVEIRSEISIARVGLVPIIPTSVTVGSGTASTSSDGVISFTSVSSVTINGVFTSQYKKYLVSYDALDSGADALLARLSIGGSASSTATYDEQFLSSVDTSVSASRNYNVTRFSLNTTGASRKTTGQFILTEPADAVWTSFTANLMARNNNTSSSTIYNVVIQGTFSATTQFDGFQIFPNGASTITGQTRIYGYN